MTSPRSIMPGMVSGRIIGLLSGVASGACYGGMVFLIHRTTGKAPASEITFLRALCAVVALFPFILRHGDQWLGRSSRLLWIRSVIGALSVLCLAWNLQHTSVGFANTLFNLAPIFVVVLGAFAGQEKLRLGRFLNVVLVVIASAFFWHGSRAGVSTAVWVVGLSGMCAASIAYAMLKSLPSLWNPFDITWCLNLATIPVALVFKHGPWIAPLGAIGLFLGAICALSLVGNALANLSFRYLELSTATALIPSAIIWGVLLDMGNHSFPPMQGIAGCLLYLIATFLLAANPPEPTAVGSDSTKAEKMTLAQHPEPLEFEDFSIQFAETNEERLEACRVRYPVFVEELHRVRYVDHGARVYSDRLDELGAHILLVRAGSKSAGTLRFTLRSETGFLDEDERLFQKVLTAVGSDNIALADRGAILPEFRGAKLYPHMWAYGFKYLRSRGIISVVGVVDASNEKLIDFHRRQGWTVLSASVIDEGKEWHLISISLTENEEPDKE